MAARHSHLFLSQQHIMNKVRPSNTNSTNTEMSLNQRCTAIKNQKVLLKLGKTDTFQRVTIHFSTS